MADSLVRMDICTEDIPKIKGAVEAVRAVETVG
jgi:hypothetical protein